MNYLLKFCRLRLHVRQQSGQEMNLFGCLFPCALQYSWWNANTEVCMTEEFVHRMGVNSSTANTGDSDNISGTVTLSDSSAPAYRDAMGAIVRYVRCKLYIM